MCLIDLHAYRTTAAATTASQTTSTFHVSENGISTTTATDSKDSISLTTYETTTEFSSRSCSSSEEMSGGEYVSLNYRIAYSKNW